MLFWLGIWCESLVCVIMGRRGVSQNAGVLVVLVSLVVVQIPMKFVPRILIDNTYIQQVNLSLPFWVLYHEYCFINSLAPGRFWMKILIIDCEADFNDSWLKCLCEFGWNCHQMNIPGEHCQHCFKLRSLDFAWCCQATSHHWLEFEGL